MFVCTFIINVYLWIFSRTFYFLCNLFSSGERTLIVSVNRITARQCFQLSICDVKYIKPLKHKHLKIVKSLQILSTYRPKGIQRNKNLFQDITSKKTLGPKDCRLPQLLSSFAKIYFFQQKEKKKPIERSRNQSKMEKKERKPFASVFRSFRGLCELFYSQPAAPSSCIAAQQS